MSFLSLSLYLLFIIYLLCTAFYVTLARYSCLATDGNSIQYEYSNIHTTVLIIYKVKIKQKLEDSVFNSKHTLVKGL